MNIPNRKGRRKNIDKNITDTGSSFIEDTASNYKKKNNKLSRLGEKLRANQHLGKSISKHRADQIRDEERKRDIQRSQSAKRTFMEYFGDEKKAADAFYDNVLLNRKRKNK